MDSHNAWQDQLALRKVADSLERSLPKVVSSNYVLSKPSPSSLPVHSEPLKNCQFHGHRATGLIWALLTLCQEREGGPRKYLVLLALFDS